MSKSYPELNTGKDLILETLKNEEEKFSSLLDKGIKILNQIITTKNSLLKTKMEMLLKNQKILINL